jgi:tetratricopeptide (TPR) repeat protein
MPFALAAAGGLLAWAGGEPRRRGVALSLSLAAVVALALLTARQAGYWRTSETLWERAVAVEPRGSYATQQLGALRYDAALAVDGEERRALLVEARRLLETSLAARPNPRTRSYLVEVLLALDDLQPAPDELRAALELTSANLERAQRRGALFSGDLLNPGRILLRLGRPAEALPALARYAKLRPDDPVGARLLEQARTAQ